MSLAEAVANVVVGYAVAVLTQVLVFPFSGLRTTMGENLAIGTVFTVVSLARSFLLRRAFEAMLSRRSSGQAVERPKTVKSFHA